MMHPIIRFNYLYRDAGNYKAWGEIYFANPDKLDLHSIDKRLRCVFDQEALFIAHQINIPEIFLYKDSGLNNDDHCFHEYDSIESIDSTNIKTHKLTMKQFIELVEKVSASGWDAFDPLDELSHIQQRLAQ